MILERMSPLVRGLCSKELLGNIKHLFKNNLEYTYKKFSIQNQ